MGRNVEWSTVLILLPPSEGKTAPTRGRPVDPSSLTRPDLALPREQVRTALARISAGPEALRTLGVGERLRQEVDRNLELAHAPAAPAAKVYTGVLYDAAGLAELTGTALRRATANVRVVSALWGVLSPADKIPAYRLSMNTTLPGIGPLARFWRDQLGRDLHAATPDTPQAGGRATPDTPQAGGRATTGTQPTRPEATGKDAGGGHPRPDVVIDCRSSAYQAAWHPPAGTPWLAVRVLQERSDGSRAVVSHHAKHTRGLLTHHLLTRPERPPHTIDSAVTAARELVGSVLREVTHVPTTKGPDQLELVLA